MGIGYASIGSGAGFDSIGPVIIGFAIEGLGGTRDSDDTDREGRDVGGTNASCGCRRGRSRLSAATTRDICGSGQLVSVEVSLWRVTRCAVWRVWAVASRCAWPGLGTPACTDSGRAVPPLPGSAAALPARPPFGHQHQFALL